MKTRFGFVTAAVAVAILTAGAASSSAAQRSIDDYLGSAGPFGAGAPWAMIALDELHVHNAGVANGNVAVADGKANLDKGFTINGKVYVASDVSVKSKINPSGGVITNDALVGHVEQDASAAAQAFDNLDATQEFDTLGSGTTLTSAGPGAFNVVRVDRVQLKKGTLTLVGDSASVFVIDVGDKFESDKGSIALAGGLQPGNVVWNVDRDASIKGDRNNPATLYGTLLAVNGKVQGHDATWNGEIVGDKVDVASGFTVNAFPAQSPLRLNVFAGYADNVHGSGTFGNTNVGAFADNGMFSNYKIVHKATLSAGGFARKLSVYAIPGVNSPSPQVLKAVIYADAGGTPGALVATGTQVTYRGDVNGAGWFDLPFAAPVQLAPGTYWLGFITGEVTEGMGYRYDVVPNSRAYNQNPYASGPTNPFGPAFEDSEDASLFATLTNPNAFPFPWRTAPGVTFVGCGYGGVDSCPKGSGGNDLYDSGALRVDVPSNASGPVRITHASVKIGPCSYDPWPGLDVTIQPGKTLILTQTGQSPLCTTSEDELGNFDTSESFEASPQYQQFLTSGTCANDGYVPMVTLTANGRTVVATDSRQVLNTHGIDPGACSGQPEAVNWRLIH